MVVMHLKYGRLFYKTAFEHEYFLLNMDVIPILTYEGTEYLQYY